MAVRCIKVTVVDPDKTEFYTIRDMLEVCGVYHYEVSIETTQAGFEAAMAGNASDCFIITDRAWHLWLSDGAPGWMAQRPIVRIGELGTMPGPSIPTAHLSIGTLLIAMREAMCRPKYETDRSARESAFANLDTALAAAS